MARKRRTIFKLDNITPALTDFSNDINAIDLAFSREILEDLGLNDTQATTLAGIVGVATISLNGMHNQTGVAADSLFETLYANVNNTTNATLTYEYKIDDNIFITGEAFVNDFNPASADGRQIIPFSATLSLFTFSKTSVGA